MKFFFFSWNLFQYDWYNDIQAEVEPLNDVQITFNKYLWLIIVHG